MKDSKAWAWSGGLGMLVIGLLVFTAVRFPVGISFLLPFAVMLSGVALVSLSILRWGIGNVARHDVLAGCAAGVLFMFLGGLELSPMDLAVRQVSRLVAPFLLLLVFAYWRRMAMQVTC